MKDSSASERGWFHRFQSVYVFLLARNIYLLIALVSLVVVIGGSIYSLYLWNVMSRQPSTIPVPPPYQETVPSVDLATVEAHLGPPTNVKFVLTISTITTPIHQGVVFGYFQADTPNKLASFPDGISIVGGRDAELFERIADSEHHAIGLTAKTALVGEITDALRDIKSLKSLPFDISVVAKDRYGITSVPTDISFVLPLGPEPVARQEPESKPEPTELQKIAGDIAKTIEPTVSPASVSAYRTATVVPSRCGTTDDNQAFVTNYRRAFEQVRSHLTTANVEAFYSGLCEAWKDISQRESAEMERAAQAQTQAIAHNNEMQLKNAADVVQSRVLSETTLLVVGRALAIFLSVSLILAFLAIESHLRAIRKITKSGKTTSSDVSPSLG